VSVACWCGGLVIAAGGVYWHQLWLGSGVIGGIGLGLGCISPVSTLIKWFPDRRGMATGMAIGTGSKASDPGGPAPRQRSFTVREACRTRQFWLVWLVLCLNVSAGIGVIGMASPMLQEVFGGRLLGLEIPFEALDAAQLGRVAAMAAGFTGLLSLFNILGRFFWSSLSDWLGRKTTYAIFFLFGIALYSAVPAVGHAGQIALFCGIFRLIMTMYGGGFAAVPAYLADLFGTGFVGAIHGRLLTAWSVASILGPVLVNYVNEQQLLAGVPRAAAYDRTMMLLAGLLAMGFVCNALIRPVGPTDMEPEAAGVAPRPLLTPVTSSPGAATAMRPVNLLLLTGFWLFVTIPMGWGLWATIRQAAVLFW
jgi:MFS family permease